MTPPTSRRSILVGAAALTALVVPGTNSAAGFEERIHTAVTPKGNAELVKTVPISRRIWGQPRSVLSLGPNEIGRLRPGEIVEAASDTELTICGRPVDGNPGPPCIGRRYRFDPRIAVRLVLARTAEATGPRRTIPISTTRRFRCTERPGHRTRHCVQQLGWAKRHITKRVSNYCDQLCHVNLIVSAYHPRAEEGQLVVVGTSDRRKRINQRRGQLNVAVRPVGVRRADSVRRTRRLITPRPPVVAKGKPVRWRVVYSQRIGHPRAGDQLLVEAKASTSIGNLPYPTHEQHAIVIANSPTATHNLRRFTERVGSVGVANGFTCTQVSSGHQTPCRVTKTGIVSIPDGVVGPLYINLIIGQEARGAPAFSRRWRPSHRTRMLGGELRIRRFRPGTMGCITCLQTPGFVKYPVRNRAEYPYHQILIGKLRRNGYEPGAYRCQGRIAQPRRTCTWRTSGRFPGGAPRYRCEQRSFYLRSRWRISLCPDALASELWHLLDQRGVDPDDVKGCRRGAGTASEDEYACSWSGSERSTGNSQHGNAYYSRQTDSWQIKKDGLFPTP